MMTWPAMHPEAWRTLVFVAWAACWLLAATAVLVLLLALLWRKPRAVAVAAVVALLAGLATRPLDGERANLRLYLACRHNVVDLQGALEVSSRNSKEGLPAKLADLVPLYLASVPTCPAARADTYSPTYQREARTGAFTVWCQGGNHTVGGARLQDYPQYRAADGLVPPLED